ncbi:DUF4831 family protein [Bacteroides sp. 214]|uniref:DUF4831 family protein n=1 Tax=Bacteroides sp. 214 TaxID=2302935 RepID=UPI0013D3976E|nr:DUF4831 family protein [Bacteroides sp. 214]NDW13361.1 DUF4831 family protein [Bacteroides sp. 214]
MRRFIVLLSILSATSTFAQTEVVQGVTRGKDYGIVYALPKTEILVEVKANKITYTPGEFSKYADRYLRLTDVSGEPETYWELTSVKATTTGIPNNQQTYFIKLKDKTVAPLVELTPDGLLKSINVPFTKEKVVEEKETATPVAKRIDPRDFLTEEILMANSTAKMAELTSKEIYGIRESRNALLRGQADFMPTDGTQLKIMLDNLDAQERAMIELFSGTRNKEERTFIIRINPGKELEKEVIFRFSKKLGIVANSDLAGEPIYLTLKDLKTLPETNEAEDDKKKKELDGVAYNVPGKARLTIANANRKEVFFDEDILVTQFGVVEYLASALFNKKTTTSVVFNPTTGGIIKVERE